MNPLKDLLGAESAQATHEAGKHAHHVKGDKKHAGKGGGEFAKLLADNAHGQAQAQIAQGEQALQHLGQVHRPARGQGKSKAEDPAEEKTDGEEKTEKVGRAKAAPSRHGRGAHAQGANDEAAAAIGAGLAEVLANPAVKKKIEQRAQSPKIQGATSHGRKHGAEAAAAGKKRDTAQGAFSRELSDEEKKTAATPKASNRERGQAEATSLQASGPKTAAAPHPALAKADVAAPPPADPSATPVKVPPPLPSVPAHWMEDPAAQLSMMGRSAHLSLDSESSGRLDVHVRVQAGVAAVRIEGEAAPVFHARATELSAALASEGLSLGNLEVGNGGARFGAQDQGADAQSKSQDRDVQRRVAAPTSSTSSLTKPGTGVHVKA